MLVVSSAAGPGRKSQVSPFSGGSLNVGDKISGQSWRVGRVPAKGSKATNSLHRCGYNIPGHAMVRAKPGWAMHRGATQIAEAWAKLSLDLLNSNQVIYISAKLGAGRCASSSPSTLPRRRRDAKPGGVPVSLPATCRPTRRRKIRRASRPPTFATVS